MAKVVGRWEGGRVIETASGKRVFYIRKRLGGRLYEVSTGATTMKAALVHWERFQANPSAYSPSGLARGKPVTIADHMDDYLARCEERGNSPNWRYQKRRYLKWWSERLPGDLRALTREKLLACLDGAAVPHNRLASLKAFCSWLADTRGLLTEAENVAATVPIPAPKPAQWKAPRAISREVYEATLAQLGDPWRDVVVVLGGTGMHTSECHRLAHGKGGVEGLTLTIWHKGGRLHRMTVEQDVADAVVRLQKHGGFSVSRLMKAIKEACAEANKKLSPDEAKISAWAPGALRHSVASWLIGKGASIEAVASYLDHDARTLKRFYNVAAIPRPAA